jgi:hypothetical protein
VASLGAALSCEHLVATTSDWHEYCVLRSRRLSAPASGASMPSGGSLATVQESPQLGHGHSDRRADSDRVDAAVSDAATRCRPADREHPAGGADRHGLGDSSRCRHATIVSNVSMLMPVRIVCVYALRVPSHRHTPTITGHTERTGSPRVGEASGRSAGRCRLARWWRDRAPGVPGDIEDDDAVAAYACDMRGSFVRGTRRNMR